MNELYLKLKEVRDLYPSGPVGEAVKEICVQIFSIAFKNDLHPDELPEIFTIKKCVLDIKSFERILCQLGLSDVEVTLIKNDYLNGNTFEVTKLH